MRFDSRTTPIYHLTTTKMNRNVAKLAQRMIQSVFLTPISSNSPFLSFNSTKQKKIVIRDPKSEGKGENEKKKKKNRNTT